MLSCFTLIFRFPAFRWCITTSVTCCLSLHTPCLLPKKTKMGLWMGRREWKRLILYIVILIQKYNFIFWHSTGNLMSEIAVWGKKMNKQVNSKVAQLHVWVQQGCLIPTTPYHSGVGLLGSDSLTRDKGTHPARSNCLREKNKCAHEEKNGGRGSNTSQ